MKLLITIDAEVYAYAPNWRSRRLADDIDRDLYGITPQGEFGVRFQARLLQQHGLKAVFFVEGLFASAPHVGPGPLQQLVGEILEAGHEVQAHLHPEWLEHVPQLGIKPGQLFEFSLAQQQLLIGTAIENLTRAGA
ncbi:MAG: hypothetical protein ABI383_10195, partial [Acidobacteriaceae bacterium]